MKSDLEHLPTSGCYLYFAENSEGRFVTKLQNKESKMYNFSNGTIIEFTMCKRGENKHERATNVGYVKRKTN